MTILAKTGDEAFDYAMETGLVWSPELGMGYYPVDPDDEPYLDEVGSREYFNKYVEYAHSEMGHKITSFRTNFVDRHWKGNVIDVGIGCGSFILRRTTTGRPTKGFDVSPAAVAWLNVQNLFQSPYTDQGVNAITLWDVLEHLPNPGELIRCVNGWVFVSIPIFENAEHVLRSKHFRQDEHRWYFTHDGLIEWFLSHGFVNVEFATDETMMGREDIVTYAFTRINE